MKKDIEKIKNYLKNEEIKILEINFDKISFYKEIKELIITPISNDVFEINFNVIGKILEIIETHYLNLGIDLSEYNISALNDEEGKRIIKFNFEYNS